MEQKQISTVKTHVVWLDVVRLIAAMADHEQALALVRQMAENLGYRLEKIPAEKVA